MACGPPAHHIILDAISPTILLQSCHWECLWRVAFCRSAGGSGALRSDIRLKAGFGRERTGRFREETAESGHSERKNQAIGARTRESNPASSSTYPLITNHLAEATQRPALG